MDHVEFISFQKLLIFGSTKVGKTSLKERIDKNSLVDVEPSPDGKTNILFIEIYIIFIIKNRNNSNKNIK